MLQNNGTFYILAIWAFCWIFANLIPEPGYYFGRMLVFVLGLVFILILVLSPFFHR